MAGYEGNEPSNKFCEIIYVGRKENGRKIRPHDVTIFFKFNSGQGGRPRSQFRVVSQYNRQNYIGVNSRFPCLFSKSFQSPGRN